MVRRFGGGETDMKQSDTKQSDMKQSNIGRSVVRLLAAASAAALYYPLLSMREPGPRWDRTGRGRLEDGKRPMMPTTPEGLYGPGRASVCGCNHGMECKR